MLQLLRNLLCFVTWDPDIGKGGVYRVGHKSIGDWLLAPPGGFDTFKVDLAAGRELILAHCRKWPSIAKSMRSPFSSRICSTLACGRKRWRSFAAASPQARSLRSPGILRTSTA